jgi:hypothetical protein
MVFAIVSISGQAVVKNATQLTYFATHRVLTIHIVRTAVQSLILLKDCLAIYSTFHTRCESHGNLGEEDRCEDRA